MRERDRRKAAEFIPHESERVDVRLTGDCLPFDDEEFDADYCTSVLEQIPQTETIVADMRRLLRSTGFAVHTREIDFGGRTQSRAKEYASPVTPLEEHFRFVVADGTVPTCDWLARERGSYPGPTPQGWGHTKVQVKHWIRRHAIRRKPRPAWPPHLPVQGLVFEPLR